MILSTSSPRPGHLIVIGALALCTLAASDSLIGQDGPDDPAPHAVQAGTLSSPDGRLSIRMALVDGHPTWAVHRDGSAVLLPGRLGFDVAEHTATTSTAISWHTSTHRETVETTWGKFSRYDDHYRQGVWTLREADGNDRTWRVVVRTYDSGVALRYEFPAAGGWQQGVRLTDERTEFRFATDGRSWCHAGEHDPTGPQPLARFHAGKGARLPLVVEQGEHSVAAVLEAAIFDTAPITLVPLDGSSTHFRARLPASTLPADGVAAWRVLLLGSAPGDLLVSPLPYCLNPPCQLEDPSWVRPGLAMWDWRAWGARTDDGFTYGLDMASWRRFVDFAAQHGVRYLVLDANWYGPEFDPKSDPRTSRDHLVVQPDRSRPNVVRLPAPADWQDPIDVPALIRYGRERGVGVILYFNDIARANYPFEETLALYREWGAAGIKYGFMRGKGQQKVLDTRTIVEACARHQLLCNFHDGPVPPSGDRRTFPNYLGREFCHSQSDAMRVFSPSGFCEQVFVNMLGGPLDMCNGLYALQNPAQDRPRIFTNVESTVVAETARVLIVFSGLAILPDCPEAYEAKADLFAFLAGMPMDWDETRILHGRIGEFVTTARRSGATWYVASATDEQARTLPIALDFLAPDVAYTATLFEDAPGAHYQTNREAYRVRSIPVQRGDTIEAAMAPGGGHCIRIVRQP